MSGTSVTRYELLGQIQVRRGSEVLDVGGPKQRAVLAVLLLDAGRVVSVDRLVRCVWGERPPPNTAASLQAYISNLRRTLREEHLSSSPIVRRQPGYVIDVDPAAVDLTRFADGCEVAHRCVHEREWSAAAAASAAALALWRGPLVQEYADEEWVSLPATTYLERRLVCQQDLVTSLLGLGRVTDALGHAAALHRDHPLDERSCWQYVLTLHRAGRTAEALSVLRDTIRTLDEELGLEPGPALRDLQAAILRQDHGLERWPGPETAAASPGVVEPHTVRASTPPIPQPAAVAPAPPLVGRRAEIAAVAGAWDEVVRGGCPWILVSGPAGIGKTRFADEVAASWRAAGARVGHVGCPDDPALPAWWPVRRLLADLGHDPGVVLSQDENGDPGSGRFAIYDRVAAVLAAATEDGPLLLHLEDVHWADPSTLGLLVHLAETSHQRHLAVLVTARDEIESGEGGPLVAAVARRRGTRIALPPLTAPEIAELVEQVSGETSTADELAVLARRTGGNPFFVGEYARLPHAERTSDVPLAVRAVLEHRLASVGSDALEILRIAAVIGEPLDLDVLHRVSGLTLDALADLLDRASDAHLLAPDPVSGGYAFAHALLREALATGLSPLRRRALHLGIAAALESRHDTAALSHRAQHLLSAGGGVDDAAVVDACRAIALDADRRWEAQEAAHWWETTLQAYDRSGAPADEARDEVVLSLLGALVRAGRGQRMLDVVDSSLLAAWREGRTASVGAVAGMLLRLTGAWPWPAYGADPGPLVSRLAGLEPQLHADPAAHARVLASLAVGKCYDLDAAVPDSLSARAIEIAESTRDPDVVADALLGRAMTYAGVAHRAEETIALVDRLAGLGHRQERFDEVIGHGIASMATIVLGDLAATTTRVRLGSERAEALRLPVSRAQFRWAQALLGTWQCDDLTARERAVAQAHRVHQLTQLTQSVTLVLVRLCLRWEEGLLAEGVGVPVDNPFLAPWIDAAVAAARRDDDALEVLTREVHRVEPTTWTSHGRATLLAHAAADLGASHLVEPLVDQLEPLADRVAGLGQCGVLGPVGLALARLHLTGGDASAARTAWTTASEVAARARSGNWLVRCRATGYAIDRAQGRRLDRTRLLATAREADSRGLRSVVRDVHGLLTDMG